MDALLEMRKVINGLFDADAPGFKDRDGKDLYKFKPGDAEKFYDKQVTSAGKRLRAAMKLIKAKSQEVKLEISKIEKAKKEFYNIHKTEE